MGVRFAKTYRSTKRTKGSERLLTSPSVPKPLQIGPRGMSGAGQNLADFSFGERRNRFIPTNKDTSEFGLASGICT